MCGAGQTRSDPRSAIICLKFNALYAVEKAFRGSALSPASEEKWLNLGTNLEVLFEVMEAQSLSPSLQVRLGCDSDHSDPIP